MKRKRVLINYYADDRTLKHYWIVDFEKNSIKELITNHSNDNYIWIEGRNGKEFYTTLKCDSIKVNEATKQIAYYSEEQAIQSLNNYNNEKAKDSRATSN